jgi:hypothetical protein
LDTSRSRGAAKQGSQGQALSEAKRAAPGSLRETIQPWKGDRPAQCTTTVRFTKYIARQIQSR